MTTCPPTDVPAWKKVLYRVPLVTRGYNRLSCLTFQGSSNYWETRYAKGGHSGAGSYGRLAEFKAQFLNEFVRTQAVTSVIEFGCGDGGQLSLAEYPRYLGFDVSTTALRICIDRFNRDQTKSFCLYDPFCFQDNERWFAADLALSLDAIYHLVEDGIYERYMRHLFQSANRFVIIYSSNTDNLPSAAHVRHRKITDWIDGNAAEFRLHSVLPNPYPLDPKNPNETSPADFFVYERVVTK